MQIYRFTLTFDQSLYAKTSHTTTRKLNDIYSVDNITSRNSTVVPIKHTPYEILAKPFQQFHSKQT